MTGIVFLTGAHKHIRLWMVVSFLVTLLIASCLFVCGEMKGKASEWDPLGNTHRHEWVIKEKMAMNRV